MSRIYAASRYSYKETHQKGGTKMWDTVQQNDTHLSHGLPCPRCGHELHTFLACGDNCACEPQFLPGSAPLAA